MNPYVVYYTNYVDGCIYLTVFTASKIKCAALHKIAIQAFRGEVVSSGAF